MTGFQIVYLLFLGFALGMVSGLMLGERGNKKQGMEWFEWYIAIALIVSGLVAMLASNRDKK